MSQALQFYEKKILADKEFPIQLVMNKSGNRERYFTMHWHEQIELHYVLRGRTRIRLEQEDALGGQGDLIICNSNILHEGFNEGVNGDPAMETMVVIFSMGDFSRELADKNIIFRSLMQTAPSVVSPPVWARWERIWAWPWPRWASPFPARTRRTRKCS